MKRFIQYNKYFRNFQISVRSLSVSESLNIFWKVSCVGKKLKSCMYVTIIEEFGCAGILKKSVHIYFQHIIAVLNSVFKN